MPFLKQGRIHSPKLHCDCIMQSPSTLFNCSLIFEWLYCITYCHYYILKLILEQLNLSFELNNRMLRCCQDLPIPRRHGGNSPSSWEVSWSFSLVTSGNVDHHILRTLSLGCGPFPRTELLQLPLNVWISLKAGWPRPNLPEGWDGMIFPG